MMERMMVSDYYLLSLRLPKALRAFCQFAALSLSFALATLMVGCATQPAEPKVKPTVVDPQQALVFVQQGSLAYEQGDISGAIKAWQRAVELNHNDAATLNNLALLLKQKHRFQEAAELLETGIKQSPTVADLHYNLAVISELYLLDLDRALTHYKRYQALSADEDKKVTGWVADLERRLD
ncbi:tetratricopeptide repeat protein [Marinobacter sp. S6332]|uniref:tetratricopeptide repeat protein n=1 Tax=Marinobacter sp. S6332 TaxID=2926403 RepID=UPI001FF2047C|nr:tetratricopeptide repeat protein [Marinobacter sp. S6332]MCK0164020.1 tetratricopeptide repeat protein [Marinobacter sp. S6332]